MPKQRNLIQEVLSLFQQLEQERQQHQRRIDEIDRALTQVRGAASSGMAPAPVRSYAPVAPASAQGGASTGRGGNVISLRQRMTDATSKQPLSVREIVEAVQRNGHKFQSADPIKSVGSYLYGPEGKKHFKRLDGKFSPLKGGAANSSARPKPAGSVPAPSMGGAQAGRGGNPMSLRQRMAEATRKQPLSVREIVEAVQRSGHKFQSADPIKSVGSYLYGPEGKKHFKRANGKFWPVAGSGSGTGTSGSSAKSGSSKPAKAKLTMSPEARQRISDAVRARWARQKAGQ
jgi:hypothetical protein